MKSTRREFLCVTAAASPMIALGAASLAHATAGAQSQLASQTNGKTMLILGGTGFLGPHIVHSALQAGYTITLFNRGKTNAEMFPELEKLRGDRTGGDLEALKNRKWDVVVDTWSFGPNVVNDAARLLKNTVEHYTFISTISVYADYSVPNRDESAPLATIPDDETDMYQWKYYGPLQALCEQAAEAAMPGRTLSIRPGLIVGPRDTSDRFTYWPVRVQRGGEVLAPGHHDDPVQFIDVRDLAEFIVHAMSKRLTGTYNATGPVAPTTMGEFLCGCKAVTGGNVSFTWVDVDFITDQGLRPWADLPAWLPPTGATAGFGTINCSKANEAGLKSRPLAETVRATLQWWHEQPESHRVALGQDTPWGKPAEAGQSPRRAGMTAAREREVLDAWHEQMAETTVQES